MLETPFTLPKEVSPTLVVQIVLISLQAHYARKAKLVTEVLNGFTDLDPLKLTATWEGLRSHCSQDRDALAYLTHWIDATLDGGEITLAGED